MQDVWFQENAIVGCATVQVTRPLVKFKDIESALRNSCSTVSDEKLERFEEWTKLYGQDGA
jgi:hypothetical protein